MATIDIPTHDVIIVGAGLSGIGAAYHLQRKCPDRNFTILEARAAMGGNMDDHGYTVCIPRFDQERQASKPLLDFDAGYIKRALDILPQQGSKAPWRVYQNHLRDSVSLKYGSLEDAYLEYR